MTYSASFFFMAFAKFQVPISFKLSFDSNCSSNSSPADKLRCANPAKLDLFLVFACFFWALAGSIYQPAGPPPPTDGTSLPGGVTNHSSEITVCHDSVTSQKTPHCGCFFLCFLSPFWHGAVVRSPPWGGGSGAGTPPRPRESWARGLGVSFSMKCRKFLAMPPLRIFPSEQIFLV